MSRAFVDEEAVEAWFGRPIVDGDRASIAWLACLTEGGREITLAGTSTLRFNEAGLVIDQWDARERGQRQRSPDGDLRRIARGAIAAGPGGQRAFIDSQGPGPHPVAMDVARRSWSALGTRCTVLTTDPAALEPACAAVVAELDQADSTYSRFRADSEVERLNRAGRPTIVSPLLAEALGTALRAARLTDGAVDPTVGRTMRAVGYDADFAVVAAREQPLVLRLEAVPGWQTVDFQVTTRRVSLPRGVELDLGSVGKALAADRAALAALAASGGPGVLVGLGGDLATAGAGPASGWPVLVADDSAAPADGPGEVVLINGGAVATSSTVVRRWMQAGVQRHHLIDPATGLPAVSPWRSATVIAGSCVDANTAATGAIIKGGAAVAWLTDLGLPARLVALDGSVLRLDGWPDGAANAA